MIKKTTNKWFTNPEHTIFCKIVVCPDDCDIWTEIEEDEYLSYKKELDALLEADEQINN